MQESRHKYVGDELDLFHKAKRWKRYYAGFISPYCIGHVLEVGAGIAGTTLNLCSNHPRKWVCLEPDPLLAERIQEKIDRKELPPICELKIGMIDIFDPIEQFDCILYIDVLEHLKDDLGEITRACRLLKPHGHLVVLSPAQKWLFTEFDQAVGHVRRYAREDFKRLELNHIQLIDCKYLDSLGTLLSLINKYVLKHQHFSAAGLWFWDNIIIPCSRVMDWIICYSFGKTILAVFENEEDAEKAVLPNNLSEGEY